MELTRRGFIKISTAGLAASSLGILGFGASGEALRRRCARPSN